MTPDGCARPSPHLHIEALYPPRVFQRPPPGLVVFTCLSEVELGTVSIHRADQEMLFPCCFSLHVSCIECSGGYKYACYLSFSCQSSLFSLPSQHIDTTPHPTYISFLTSDINTVQNLVPFSSPHLPYLFHHVSSGSPESSSGPQQKLQAKWP